MNGVASMTGFAAVQGSTPEGRSFSLTIKAVNHRHLDLAIRLPPGLDVLESALRRQVKGEIRRGHVELTLLLEKSAVSTRVEVDEALLGEYVRAFREAAEQVGVEQAPDLNALIRMPGVVTAGVAPIDTGEMETAVLAAAEEALRKFQEGRGVEGEALAAELRAGMERIAAFAEEARLLRTEVAAEEYAKLSARLAELLGTFQVSEERLLTEAALLAARSDVEEELVRLRTHLDRFVELLAGGGEVGRALDFLLQELNRETNTLLSKTGANAGLGGLRLTEIGLAVKVELERAREQVQNLE